MINMKKIFLFLIFTPYIIFAQPSPPQPGEENLTGPSGPGYQAPIDNSIFLLLLSVIACIVVFLYYKRFAVNK
jgi:hypothetical protein